MKKSRTELRSEAGNEGSSSNQSSNWRVFCAVEIPPDVAERALSHIVTLKSESAKIQASWNREGKLHLTLKFLGHIPQPKVTDVSRACEIATRDVAKFQISVGNTGAFPKHGPPRVLWIGVDDLDGKLGKLQTRLEDACSKVGFPREDRPFHPHLTLARLRSPQGAKELGQVHRELGFAPATIDITELLVFRSELSPQGARYSVVSRHPLTSTE
jgi:RNA 2',3'-cyclic 3'-phosphodiesterase